MTDFRSDWQDLVEHARQNTTVQTFVRESENQLDYDANQEAIVFESNSPDRIPRETWERAWVELHRTGELTIDSFKEATGTYRASVALPFLAEALDLRADANERRVWIEESTNG
jgi:hypothetical protein